MTDLIREDGYLVMDCSAYTSLEAVRFHLTKEEADADVEQIFQASSMLEPGPVYVIEGTRLKPKRT